MAANPLHNIAIVGVYNTLQGRVLPEYTALTLTVEALFGAIANATLAARLAHAPMPGLPGDLDSVSHALQHPAALTADAADYLRRAVASAVSHVYIGAAIAAVLSLLVLLFLAPRRFPVLAEHSENQGSDAA